MHDAEPLTPAHPALLDLFELRYVAVTGSPHSASLHAGYRAHHERQASRISRFGVGSQFGHTASNQYARDTPNWALTPMAL